MCREDVNVEDGAGAGAEVNGIVSRMDEELRLFVENSDAEEGKEELAALALAIS